MQYKSCPRASGLVIAPTLCPLEPLHVLSSPRLSTPVTTPDAIASYLQPPYAFFFQQLCTFAVCTFTSLFAPVILTPCARADIAERLPWEILESICGHCGEAVVGEDIIKEASDRHFASNPVPRPEYEAALASLNMVPDTHFLPKLPLAIHEENKRVLLMTHVCRNWRRGLTGSKRLWRNIAFSANKEPIGIGLATFFLSRISDDDIPLHIYAGLPFVDVPNPTIGALLSRLREKTHRWERFLYWGRLGPYRSYLDLPAPSLRYFSDHMDLCHIYFGLPTQLFAGNAPILQSLVTSTLGSWNPASLTNLRSLDLWDCALRLSVESLLTLLRHASRLEEFSIASPNPPLINSPSDEVVDLPHLKNLKVHNPDFYAIIGHLTIPKADAIHLYSSACNQRVGRPFQTAHPFVGLASMANPLPMLWQPILLCTLTIEPILLGLMFSINITTNEGADLRIDVEWTDDVGADAWPNYIQNSMSALAEMPFFSPSILSITAPLRFINYDNPLFRLDAIGCLVVDGESFMAVVKFLSSSWGPLPLLPKLLFLIFPVAELYAREVRAIPRFLRFRGDLAMVLNTKNGTLVRRMLTRACFIKGGSISLETTSSVAD